VADAQSAVFKALAKRLTPTTVELLDSFPPGLWPKLHMLCRETVNVSTKSLLQVRVAQDRAWAPAAGAEPLAMLLVLLGYLSSVTCCLDCPHRYVPQSIPPFGEMPASAWPKLSLRACFFFAGAGWLRAERGRAGNAGGAAAARG
jgi:hypothetical protein